MRTRLPMLVVSLGLAICATTEAAAASNEKPQASVESQRAELYPKVTKFLTEAAALEPAFLAPQLEYPTKGELAGWRDKVCPQVTGLDRGQEEFILARVAQIARAVGVATDDPHCRANLYVVVTAQPNELLKVIGKQNAYYMFGPRWRPYFLDQFAANPQPVTVWYNIHAGRSVSFRFAFSRVLIIVDRSRLQGVSPSQLADYVAMVGFAEIKPGAHVGDAPTILKLFDSSATAAPAGLSGWDQAFLKSLYTNSRALPWRRELGTTDLLALSMVSEIVP
jgi:hypothetical protein